MWVSFKFFFYIFFAKSTLVASNYSEFDRETGIFLQYFARDVKEAEDVVWISEKNFKLLKKGIYVTYSYNPKLQTVTRSSPGQVANTMASHLSALQFAAYDITGRRLRIAQDLDQAGLETKMMQVIGSSSARTTAGTQTSASVISARYILRNKATTLP